jgi:rubrerythrin
MPNTRENLELAFIGESKAHMLYHYFAKVARAEGYEDLAREFDKTAEQETQHAYCVLEMMYGKLSTRGCLQMAVAGETEKFENLYPDSYAQAVTELQELESSGNITPIAEHKKAVLIRAEKCFKALTKVELQHHTKYQKILKDFT